MSDEPIIILGIESSCDETSAAVCFNGRILSNIIANQTVHEQYGGVVPELASRAHQQNIIPTVELALTKAKISKNDVNAVAFTRGPGLLGSLLVGTSFAKAFCLAQNIPLMEVNHMQAHILAHFIRNKPNGELQKPPIFPFICLTVSGGHTQLVLLRSYFDMELIGETMDDAAGEAFDKTAKILGLPYPGGPLIDKYAKQGNPFAFKFSEPSVSDLNYSFSGLKTSILYFLTEKQKENSNFIENNLNDICASVQHTIISILMRKVKLAAQKYNVNQLAIAGGVSANSGLRSAFEQTGKDLGWDTYIPDFEYCTDNAAMIAIAGYYKYLANDFVGQDVAPLARWSI